MANLRVDKITSTETFETTGSVQFFRVPSSRLTTDLGSGLNDNFTIEFWILASGIVSGSNSPGMFQLSDTSGGFKTSSVTLAMYWSTGQNMLGIYDAGGDSNLVPEDSNENDVWKHYAMVRNNGVLKVYRNGEEVYSAVNSNDYTSDRYLVIGGYWSTSYVWQGHISNFRILNNKALYTENFKPPMRELELTPETVLLACQSKTDATHEKTGKTITVAGSAIANELTPGILTPVPKAGGNSAIKGSVEFDGSGPTAGGYLEVTPDDDLQFLHKCTDSYTVEAWVHKQASTQGTIFDSGGSSNTTIGIVLFGDSGGVLKFRARQALSALATSITTGDVMANDMWHHVALTYDKSTVRLFVNGILAGSASYSTESSVDSTQSFKIGAYEYSGTTKDGYFNGYISNLRIVKGTALYTDNFIPSTRELKKVPGTVLLCCQDPDNPLTEATGKTITGYGNLSPGGGSNLISNAYDAYAPGDTTGWSTDQGASLSVSSGRLRVTNGTSDYGIAQTSITTITGQRYLVTADFHAGTGQIGELRASNTSFSNTLGSSNQGHNATGPKSLIFTAASTTTYINVFGSNNNGQYTEWANFSVTLAEGSNKGSNFTPQVGDDRKVTFEGVTKINSENYFYLPTGDTASRETTGTYSGGTRGIFGGGFVGPGGADIRDTIQFINIASTGTATDGGDLTQARYGNAALASSTRALWAGGLNPSPSYFNIIDAVEIMSKGDAVDFGDLYTVVYYPGGVSNRTRGLYAGGYRFPAPAGFRNEIGYVTIASKGDSQDFGDLTTARNSFSTFGSPTRGCLAGGATPGKVNSIEYVTISSTGNSKDFGDLTVARNYAGGCSSAIRGLMGGGANPSADNTIDYVTIATTGTAEDFGDLTSARTEIGSCSSATRGIFAGSWSPSKTNTIDFVNIQTTGNAQLFGELINKGVMQEMGTSNGHGGLG